MIQQAAPMPAMKAGCLTTSEICWERGFSMLTDSVIRPAASDDGEWSEEKRARLERFKDKVLVMHMWNGDSYRCDNGGEENKYYLKPKPQGGNTWISEKNMYIYT